MPIPPLAYPDGLLNKRDGWEIVRDQIGAILFANAAQQVIDAAGEPDPQIYALDVFLERYNPWEQNLNVDIEEAPGTTRVPVVNVWFTSGDFDRSAGGSSGKSVRHTANFYIDCVGFGIARDDPAGHVPGDLDAVLSANRAVRQCRNYLMMGQNHQLQLGAAEQKLDPPPPDFGVSVWDRWVTSISAFQPEQGENSETQVAGMRLVLQVGLSETSPELTGAPLELVSLTVVRSSDGKILALADYDYT